MKCSGFMKFFACIAASLALLGCGGGGGSHGGGTGPGMLSGISVTLDGDSILFGAGLEAKPAQVLRAAGLAVDDKSAVGLTLHDLLSGYAEPYKGAPASDFPNGPQPAYASVARQSGVVVLEVGVNDALALVGVDVFTANMRAAIEILLREGRAVVLTGIVQIDERNDFVNAAVMKRRAEFNEVTHQLAAEYGLTHAGWGEDYLGPQDSFDGIHRTQEASNRLANRLVHAMHRAAIGKLFGGAA